MFYSLRKIGFPVIPRRGFASVDFFGALGKMDTSYMRCILPLFGFKAQLRLLGLSARAVRRPFRLCVRCMQAGSEHILGGYIIDGLGSLNHS